MEYKLNILQNPSITDCVVSDILTYEIIISNISDTIVENVILKNVLPQELKFILGSVTINNIDFNCSNITSGISLGTLCPNETKTVTFKAEILEKVDDFIENKSLVEFEYKDKDKLKYDYCYSNASKIFIKNLNLSIQKYTDKKSVQLNDEITYTIKISYIGDLDLYNLNLISELPKEVTLIDSSFTIDNKILNSVELEKGVMLNHIKVGESKEIKYKVIVSGGCNTKIKTKSVFRYSYILPNGNTGHKESKAIISCIDIKPSNFKQISIDNFIKIPFQKPILHEINDIDGYIKINKYNIIKTSIAKSTEGQILSGYKLLIHGYITQIVKYTACEPTNPIHSTQNNIPFSSYIVLPHNFKIENKVEVEGIVENIYFSKVNERTIFSNITLSLLAKIACYN